MEKQSNIMTTSLLSQHKSLHSLNEEQLDEEPTVRGGTFFGPSTTKQNGQKGLKHSASRLSLLTRATSFMTWDTDTSSKRKYSQNYDDDDEEGQHFTILSKKKSLQSFSGITILPTIYGSITNKPEDDDISECSYMTGVEEDFENDTNISLESSWETETDSHSGHTYEIRNVFAGNFDTIERTSNLSNNDDDQYLNVDNKKNNTSPIAFLVHNMLSTSTMVHTKSKGVRSHQPAPRFPLSECIWTFTGSFTIIFILCFLSTNITLWNDHGHAFPLGPFGALTTLQYSLGDAAPAQPRNVILGSTLSGCVALCSTYIPESILSITLRIALAASISIALMAGFGIMHPPGGAIALVFAMGHYHWGHLLLTLGGCWIAVFLATIINNLNPTRQYPEYWDFSAPLEKSSIS